MSQQSTMRNDYVDNATTLHGVYNEYSICKELSLGVMNMPINFIMLVQSFFNVAQHNMILNKAQQGLDHGTDGIYMSKRTAVNLSVWRFI